MTLKFCAAVLPLLAAGAAMGGITYTLDQRGAMVSVYVGGMSDWLAAQPPSSLAEFHTVINRKVDVINGTAEAQAWQDSSVTPTGIFMHAGSWATATPVDQCAGGMGEAMGMINFHISVPTTFTLSGFMNASGDTEARVTIKDASGTLLAGVENVVGWQQLTGSGTLQPGDYFFAAAGNSFVSSCPSRPGPEAASSNVTYIAALSFAELPQCPADFNGDTFLDFTDFDDFVAAFEAGLASSDFNGDGFLDFTDFDDFVVAFEAGC